MTKLRNCNIYAKFLGQFHAGPMVAGSVRPFESRLVDSVAFVVVSLTASGSFILFSPSSVGCPKLLLMFDCGVCICLL